MTRTTFFRFTILHASQSLFTDALTFMFYKSFKGRKIALEKAPGFSSAI
jgi:hypothetical protein